MSEPNEWQNFNWESDDQGLIWIGFDRANSGTNVLSSIVFAELERLLLAIKQAQPTGVVFYSAKASGFLAGADVNEFTEVPKEEAAFDFIRSHQVILDQVEALNCPTLCVIQGFCLGGGTEFALACDYRLAIDEPKTRIGLPEVRLGIHPGYGGTVRLPPLVGALPAMDMMLSGRTLSARAAKKIGLVDLLIPARQFRLAAREHLLKAPAPARPAWHKRIAGHKFARSAVAALLRKQVAKRARPDHYPAPYALIELWKDYADDPQRMMVEEARSVAKLLSGEVAQNLIRLFQLQNQLKETGKQSDFRARHVHVIGAGVMGGDIAAWCALQGLQVSLQDQVAERIAPAIKRAHELFKKRLKVRRPIQAAMDRLYPDVQGLGVRRADVIIEAIFENRDAKHALYQSIEPQMKDNALLCTNTSSIPLGELSDVLKHPGRLVGLHFFNPVAKMQLVEVVWDDHSDQDRIKAACAFTRQIDRLPLPVRSSPGFLVNRVLMPYLLEAVTLLEEGQQKELIDKAALDFGMPMGPLELADTVGLDICLSVAEILTAHLGGEIPGILAEHVKHGNLGRKTGQGFYQWQRGKPKKERLRQADAQELRQLQNRMMLRYFNESVACLREGVVANADLLDAGMVFGTGFAPFRGGPMHYVRQSGLRHWLDECESLSERHGERFIADSGWELLG